VQLFDHLGMLEYYFRNERARLQVPAAFAFEKITFGAHDWAIRQQAEQIGHTILQGVSVTDLAYEKRRNGHDIGGS